MREQTPEQSLLGIIIADPSSRHEAIRLVGADHFISPPCRKMWEASMALGDGLTPQSLISSLKKAGELEACGGADGVMGLYLDATGREHLEFFAGEMLEASTRRLALAVASAIKTHLDGDEMGPAEVVSEAINALGSLAAGGVELPDIRQDLLATVENIEAEATGNVKTGLVTRWDEMNERMPIRRGSYVVIGGKTSSGKSVLAGNLALDVVQGGEGVAFFSYEMSKDDLIRRMIADGARIRPERLFQPRQNRMTAGDMASLVEMQRMMAQYPLHIFDDPNINVAKISALAHMLVAEGGLGAIFVDYLQLVPMDIRGANRELQVATASRQLRALALDTGVPVVVLTQLNDEGETRESKAIKQDAEILINIEEEGLWVCKQRNGPKNFPLGIKLEPGTIRFQD